jgi:hypothetical protein
MAEPRIITNRTELRVLLGAPRRAPFTIDLPDLSTPENAALQTRLRRLVDACGCAEAAAGLLLGLGLDVASWLALPSRSASLAYYLLLPPFLMFIGKRLGLWRARRRLRRLIARLEPTSLFNI